jgi:hypothetical protein
MSALTAAMDTALAADRVLIFGAVQIDLPSYTLRLLDGMGELSFNGGTFVGKDSTFGAIDAIDALDDGMGDEAPHISLTLLPSSSASATTLAASAMQGSRVRVWLGAISAGAVVADPYLLFDGEVDQPTLTLGKATRSLEYEAVSSFERLFDVDEGFRLVDSEHQRIWPGETGLENVTALPRTLYWGLAAPVANAGATYGAGDWNYRPDEVYL